MSHRVTTQTEITSRTHALAALSTLSGVTHKDLGKDKIEIKSGRSTGILDLSTGQIVGDTDRWQDTDFDALKQAYAVESYVAELIRQGASIQQREVDAEGRIVILYQTTG